MFPARETDKDEDGDSNGCGNGIGVADVTRSNACVSPSLPVLSHWATTTPTLGFDAGAGASSSHESGAIRTTGVSGKN